MLRNNEAQCFATASVYTCKATTAIFICIAFYRRTTGFEPANHGVTIQCLTTWLRPPFYSSIPNSLFGNQVRASCASRQNRSKYKIFLSLHHVFCASSAVGRQFRHCLAHYHHYPAKSIGVFWREGQRHANSLLELQESVLWSCGVSFLLC